MDVKGNIGGGDHYHEDLAKEISQSQKLKLEWMKVYKILWNIACNISFKIVGNIAVNIAEI